MHRCVIAKQTTRDELVPVVSLVTDKLAKIFFERSIVMFPLAIFMFPLVICLKVLHQVVDDWVHQLSSLVANQSVNTAKAASNGVQNICH